MHALVGSFGSLQHCSRGLARVRTQSRVLCRHAAKLAAGSSVAGRVTVLASAAGAAAAGAPDGFGRCVHIRMHACWWWTADVHASHAVDCK